MTEANIIAYGASKEWKIKGECHLYAYLCGFIDYRQLCLACRSLLGSPKAGFCGHDRSPKSSTTESQ